MESLERNRRERRPRTATARRVRMLLIGLALIAVAGLLEVVQRSLVPPPRARPGAAPDAREAGREAPAPRGEEARPAIDRSTYWRVDPPLVYCGHAARLPASPCRAVRGS